MKSNVGALLVIVPVIGIASLIGCAEGVEAEPTESFLASTPIEAGTEEKDDSVKIPAPSNPSDEPDDTEDTDSGASNGNADAGADSGVKPDPGNNGGSCSAPNSCASNVNLGSVSGDTGADVKTTQGHTSQWFTVRVTENETGPAGVSLWLTATLTSPPGTNYDLYVYVPGSDTLECSAVTQQSTSSATTDVAKVEFGESGLFANGSSDDRTVTVEVRHVSGTCDPANKWTLKLEGNK